MFHCLCPELIVLKVASIRKLPSHSISFPTGAKWITPALFKKYFVDIYLTQWLSYLKKQNPQQSESRSDKYFDPSLVYLGTKKYHSSRVNMIHLAAITVGKYFDPHNEHKYVDQIEQALINDMTSDKPRIAARVVSKFNLHRQTANDCSIKRGDFMWSLLKNCLNHELIQSAFKLIEVMCFDGV